MSPEISHAEQILNSLTPRQKEKLALATIFFYVEYFRHERNTGWIKEKDPSSALDELLGLIPEEELMRDTASRVLPFLLDDPLRRTVFPEHTDSEIKHYFERIYNFFQEQESLEQIHGGSYYDDTDPVEFALYTTYIVTSWGPGSYRILPDNLSWKDGEKIIKNVTLQRQTQSLEANLRGFLTPGEFSETTP